MMCARINADHSQPAAALTGGLTSCILTLLLILAVQCVHAQDNWPRPFVVFYDCNSSAASTDNAAQRTALNSSSRLLFQYITQDTSCQQVFFFSYGFSDTTAADMASSGMQMTYSDTSASSDAVYDFIITSTITGKPGGYTLSISILDRYTKSHAADGTASFASATDDNVKAACLSAVRQILPLTTKIRNYQKTLKAGNPLYVINPEILVEPAELNPALNGSTDVSISVIDCDGLPIAGRQLKLESTRGSFASSSVQTDAKGKASVVFSAGTTPGAAILNATLLNMVSVIRDTLGYRGSASLMLGKDDKRDLWVLKFDLSRSYSGCLDKLITESEGTRWRQKTQFWIQHARGSFMAEPTDDDHTEFGFNDSTLSVSGIYFAHDFEKETYTDITGKTCPQTDWSMGGNTRSYAAETNEDHDGEADFDYDPEGLYVFAIAIPYTYRDAYGYEWYTDGKWEKGQCKSELRQRGTHFKLYFNTTGGMTYFGTPPIPGLSIVPWKTGSTITGYSINVSTAWSGFASDGSYYFTKNQCTATLMPLKKTTPVEQQVTVPPAAAFSLAQNYPNPFNPSTRISFSLASGSFVTLKVFDLMGRESATIVSGELPAGEHTRQFDAAGLPSGMYFYRLQAGGFTETRKFILLR